MHVNVRNVGVVRVGVCITVYMRERGGGDGEGADSETPSLPSYTLRYISLTDLDRLSQWGFR